MRFLVDLHWMVPGQAGGIENLTRSLLNEFMTRDLPEEFWIWLPEKSWKAFSWESHPNFHPRYIDKPWMRSLDALCCRLDTLVPLIHLDRIPRWKYWTGTPAIDTVLALPGYIHKQLLTESNLLMIADIQQEYHPEFFTPADLELLRRRTAVSIRIARHICTFSQFTRDGLIERLGVSADRLTVLRPSVDPSFYPGSPARTRSQEILAKYNLPRGQYLFFPGHTWPHKNHAVALRMLSILQQQYHLEPLLVCTGNPRGAQPKIMEIVADLHLEKTLRFLGYCPGEEMPALYQGAAALIFPSLFEGFGIPLLEAMWCGCPIICSPVGSLPEIAGSAAQFADPLSAESLAQSVYQVLTDKPTREKLIEAGYKQVLGFSWSSFAEGILLLLRQIAAG